LERSSTPSIAGLREMGRKENGKEREGGSVASS